MSELSENLEEQIQEIIFDAHDLFNNGEISGSIEKLRSGIVLLPGEVSEYDLGFTLVQEICERAFEGGMKDVILEWIDEYEKADKAQRNFGDIEYLKGRIEFQEENHEAARNYFSIAEEKSEGNIWEREDAKPYFEFMNPQLAVEVQGDRFAVVEEESQLGNAAMGEGKFEEALTHFKKALAQIPDPKTNWEAATWLYTAIGDAYFFMEEWTKAKNAFYDALNCPNGHNNGFIALRLGQVLFEFGDSKTAEFLLRAYMLEGKEIFENEDPIYFSFLNHNYEL